MSQNQLSSYDIDTNNIIFSKPEIGNIPGQKISFKRLRIACKYPDGTMGDLIFPTPEKLHSFGLQESRDLGTDKLNGYVLPLCLWNRNGATAKEQQFTDLFNRVSDLCKKYLVEHKEEIEKYDLDYSDLKKFNPLYWKMEKGKPVEGKGPMLYVKVLLNKKNNKINTIFVDEETNKEIDPFTVLNKPCHVTAAIKFESIFIGNKISLQVKLYEVVVKKIDNTIRGLLRPDASKLENGKVGCPVEVSTMDSLGYEEEEDHDIQMEHRPTISQHQPENHDDDDEDDDDEDDEEEDDEGDENDDEGSIGTEAVQKPVVTPTPVVDTKKRAPRGRAKAKA